MAKDMQTQVMEAQATKENLGKAIDILKTAATEESRERRIEITKEALAFLKA